MSDQQTKQRSQAELLAALKYAVRHAVPTATSIDVGTTDQHVGLGFVLSEVHLADGSTLSETDPKRLDELTDDNFGYLADLDWDGVVGEDWHGYATIPLVREVPIGTEVVYAGHEGVYRYDGLASHGAFEEIAFSFGDRGPHGLRCDPDRVAPKDAPIPERDNRVTAIKRVKGEYPNHLGPWQLVVGSHQHGFHKTKRDATAAGLRTVAIDDWHASAPEPSAEAGA